MNLYTICIPFKVYSVHRFNVVADPLDNLFTDHTTERSIAGSSRRLCKILQISLIPNATIYNLQCTCRHTTYTVMYINMYVIKWKISA